MKTSLLHGLSPSNPTSGAQDTLQKKRQKDGKSQRRWRIPRTRSTSKHSGTDTQWTHKDYGSMHRDYTGLGHMVSLTWKRKWIHVPALNQKLFSWVTTRKWKFTTMLHWVPLLRPDPIPNSRWTRQNTLSNTFYKFFV